MGALVGAKIVGPRDGRFEEGVDQEKFDAHNVAFIVLGTIILWFGWSAKSACNLCRVPYRAREVTTQRQREGACAVWLCLRLTI